MPYDIFAALLLFSLVTAFTPGPNTIMVTASGVNFGFVRTIPHMAGITVGFMVLISACAAGLGALFTAVPALQTALKVVGAAYLLWLAWKVANARPAGEEKELATPMTFWQAAAFQWVNPKAVMIGIALISIYIRPDHRLTDFLIVFTVNAVFCAASVVTWTGFGVALRGLLTDPRRARIFNICMALLLVASIVPMVL